MSIRLALKNIYPSIDIFPFHTYDSISTLANLSDFEHRRLIAGHFYYSFLSERPHYANFTVIRNPIDISLSAILHAKRDSVFGRELTNVIRDMSIEQIICNESIMPAFSNIMCQYLSTDVPTKEIISSKTYYTTSPSDLASCLHRIHNITYILNHDSLDCDFSKMSYLLNLPFLGDLPRVNDRPVSSSPKISLLSDHAQSLLRDYNQSDIALYKTCLSLSKIKFRLHSIKNNLTLNNIALHYHSFSVFLRGPQLSTGLYEPEQSGTRWAGCNREGFSYGCALYDGYSWIVNISIPRGIVPLHFLEALSFNVNGFFVNHSTNVSASGSVVISLDIPRGFIKAYSGCCCISCDFQSSIMPSIETPVDRRNLLLPISVIEFLVKR